MKLELVTDADPAEPHIRRVRLMLDGNTIVSENLVCKDAMAFIPDDGPLAVHLQAGLALGVTEFIRELLGQCNQLLTLDNLVEQARLIRSA